MARVTTAGYLTKWGQRLNGATQAIQDGVSRVTTAPGVSAAAAQALMLQRITEAINSGKWAKGVSSVSLQDWQAAMKNKGIGRIPAGVSAAQASTVVAQHITTLLNNVDQASAAANALPKGGLEQSIARASAFMRTMSQLSAAGK